VEQQIARGANADFPEKLGTLRSHALQELRGSVQR
jgi:hypothetical protein